jgi:CBS domain-containing protein
MKVREIMTSGSLATATLDTTVEEIANMMKSEDVGAIPVLDDEEKLAGIITDRDIVIRAIAEGEDPTQCTAEDILSGQLHIIEPEADVRQALELMSRHQIRRLPVVEENQVIGILALGDISVKSGQEEAGEALEDISAGVRQGQQSRQHREAQPGPGQSGRARNASPSRQRSAGDAVNTEGGEERKPQNPGGGQARQRANKQNAASRGRQESSTRGRDSGAVRGEDAGRDARGKAQAQGISNRGSRQENQRQQKVAPMRVEGKNPRGQNKRRAG